MNEAQRLVDEAQQLIASLALFAPNDAEREVTIVAARLSGVVNRLALAEQASGKAQQAALTRHEINELMSQSGWQNSALRQADLDGVERIVRKVEARATPPETPAAQQAVGSEPVAWVCRTKCGAVPMLSFTEPIDGIYFEGCGAFRLDELTDITPLYAHPPSDQASEKGGTPRFSEVFCSQCGRGFGPGNEGFSNCSDHAGKRQTS